MTPEGPGWGPRQERLVAWYDPGASAAAGRDLSGRDFLERILAGAIAPPPIAELLGMRLTSLGDGEAVFTATPDSSVYNPIGMVHGGFLCTLLDSAAGCAVHTRLPAGSGYASIEIKVSFLRPLRAGLQLEVSGRALRVGGRVAFAEAHARTFEGELVGHATSSLAVIRAIDSRDQTLRSRG